MTRERVGARAVYGAPPAPSCANCGRVVHVLDYRVGSVHFCSPMCRDTAKEPAPPKREYITARACDVPNCFVCSGAMRERAGKGDDT